MRGSTRIRELIAFLSKCRGRSDIVVAFIRECCDLFFPVFPTLALYILGTANEHYSSTSTHRQTSRSTIWIDVGLESPSDVHLRNAMILQTYPHFLYFSSLRTVALSISSYDEFRWIQEHQDYSRLKQRCRQKFLQEAVTKTLVVKGSVILTDLTDEVVKGEAAVAHGTFSDVWKGIWNDPIERRPRPVSFFVVLRCKVNSQYDSGCNQGPAYSHGTKCSREAHQGAKCFCCWNVLS